MLDSVYPSLVSAAVAAANIAEKTGFKSSDMLS